MKFVFFSCVAFVLFTGCAGGPCSGSPLASGLMCSSQSLEKCGKSFSTVEGYHIQCGKSGQNCLTIGPFCDALQCDAESVISNNVATNDNKLETSGKGGYEVTLSNGDLVWSQNTYGSTERGLGQAFDAYTQKKWDRAWHGKCNGVNYKTTALQLRYTFSSGNKLLTKVKVWQVPGAGHQAGQIDVMYWTGSEWEAVSGQSPSGFQSTGYGEELTISFNSVSTDQLRLDFYSHNSASNPICVGATEVQLIGCNAWPHKTASEDKRTRQGLLSARRAETFASDMRWHRPKEWFRTSRFHSFSEEVALLAYMQNPLTCL